MGIHVYLQSLNKLERIIRCPGEFKFEEHNVASHSFKVTQYAQLFGTIEERNGVAINWKSLYEKAINHDVPEFLTGDIVTPVKYSSPELREMLGKVEEEMTKKFVEAEFPEDLKVLYMERFKEAKDETIEGQILAVCDKLDQVYEAYNEIQKGNTAENFVFMYQNALLAIRKIKISSVDYFFDTILPEMLNEVSNSVVDIRQITEELLSAN